MNIADLTPVQLRRRLAGPGLHFQAGPFVLHVRSSLQDIARGVGALYADFPLADPAFADYHARFARPRSLRRFLRPQVWFDFDGHTPFKPLPLDQAMPMFEWCLNWCIASHANQYLVIHAAVIEKGGRAVVLPGTPGAGKSTLCAGLIHRGWRLLSDELCLVRLTDGHIAPLPRPVSLKNESIDLIRRYASEAVIGRASHDTLKGAVAHLRPPAESVRRAAETARPAWIIFPRFQKDAPATLTPALRGLTFMRIADHAFNYSLLGVSGFEAMSRLVESCECHDFTYSQLDDAVATFNTLDASPHSAVAPGHEATASQPIALSQPAPRPPSSPREILWRTLRDPRLAREWTLPEWDLLVRQARHALILPRLCVMLEDAGLLDAVPERPRLHLLSARFHAAKHERTLRWEVNRIARALAGTGIAFVLLKGAAYALAGLPPARGRVVSDTDILVSRGKIDAVEAALRGHGWEPTDLDAYDQRYYRNWMHELPPLRHRQRQSVLDVHHNILPPTARLKPDARKLIAASRPLEGNEMIRILAPADMVLHSATHLFHDGELEHGLRDLVDLDLLLRHFGAREAFWEELVTRGFELGLQRPLFYALRYTADLLATPVPERAAKAALRGAPKGVSPALMAPLFHRALASDHASCRDGWTPLARWLLYVRSHYLRMPPHLLLPHLARKAIKRRLGPQA